jgi:hypothetical protein
MPKMLFRISNMAIPSAGQGKNKSFKGVNPIQPAAQKNLPGWLFADEGAIKITPATGNGPDERGIRTGEGLFALGAEDAVNGKICGPCPVRALLGKFDAAGEAAIDGGIIDQGRDWARQIIQARLEPELAGKHCTSLGWRDGEDGGAADWQRRNANGAQKIAVIAGKTGHKFARGAVCRYTARVIWMIRDAAFPAGSEVVGKIEVCRHFSSLIFADFNMVKTQSCLEARREAPRRLENA